MNSTIHFSALSSSFFLFYVSLHWSSAKKCLLSFKNDNYIKYPSMFWLNNDELRKDCKKCYLIQVQRSVSTVIKHNIWQQWHLISNWGVVFHKNQLAHKDRSLLSSAKTGWLLHEGSSWLHCRYKIHILWPKLDLPPSPCNRAWTECNHLRNRGSVFCSTCHSVSLYSWLSLQQLKTYIWCLISA